MQKMRHSVLTSDLTGKWKAWPDLSTDMYLLLIQGRLYQLAMLAVSAIDTQRVSVRYKTCQLLLRNYIDKLYELSVHRGACLTPPAQDHQEPKIVSTR